MTKKYTEQVFRTTYRDDFLEEDNYHRVLFNSGKALQARELTQLQTIIQKEISRLGSNLFVEGAAIKPGGLKIEENYHFIKLVGPSTLPDISFMPNSVFVESTSGIKVRVNEAVSAIGTDPETLYVSYISGPAPADATDTFTSITAGSTLTGIVNGNTVNVVVQTTNTATNPAVGKGSLCQIAEGSFFIQGHMVFCPAQTIILDKYATGTAADVGFKVIQDIVTVEDDDALYDNTGVTPNLASPGADRYRIRLELTTRTLVDTTDVFVHLAAVIGGQLQSVVTASSGFNSIKKEMALRTKEESGDYIKKNFTAHFEPNSSTDFRLKVGRGIAYINGYRVEKLTGAALVVPKAQDTFVQNNEGISINYGSFYEYAADSATSGGMFNTNTNQLVYLKNSANAAFGTANVRAVQEGKGNLFNLHLFNIQQTDATVSFQDVKTVSTVTGANSDANPWVTLKLDSNGYAPLKEPNKGLLIFDTPIQRPKALTDISLTVARRFASPGVIPASGLYTITLGDDEDFTSTNDWIVSDEDTSSNITAVVTLTNSKSATISNLPVGQNASVIAYVSKQNGTVRQKTLTEVTASGTLSTDANGQKFIALGKSDIYSVDTIKHHDATGDDLSPAFFIDNGQRDTHYGDGRLMYKGYGLDSDGAQVHVTFKHFSHGNGDFFAVNSYVGQLGSLGVDYGSIPSHRLQSGSLVSLRDVIDFRPSTDGAGNFNTVSELPRPTSLITADTEYYLPRNDKLCLSETGELRYVAGSSSLDPKYPTTPNGTIELFKFQMNPNTLHTKDLRSKLMPLKAYTMADIGRIDKKLERLEEVTTMSLLELSTAQTRLVDSDGNERIKSGFFVDNFKDQTYTDTKSIEHRSAMDPQHKYIRPSFISRETLGFQYDAADTGSVNTKKVGDKLLLDYSELPQISQTTASRIVNVNPFFIQTSDGNLKLSPAGDNWFNTEVTAPSIVDGGTRLDTTQALLWNNWEWNWSGVNVNDLSIGDEQSHSSISTSQTENQLEPVVVGHNVQPTTANWTYYGNIGLTIADGIGSFPNLAGIDFDNINWSALGVANPHGMPPVFSPSTAAYTPKTIVLDTSSLGDSINQDAGPGDTITGALNQFASNSEFDPRVGNTVGCTAVITGGTNLTIVVDDNVTGYQVKIGSPRFGGLTISGGVDVTGVDWDENTIDIIEVEATTTTTETETTTETTTNTSTTVTVNRIAGESTIREVIGNKVLDICFIPWLRSRTVSFRATGLLANTKYFPYFDTTDVAKFCKAKPFVFSSDRDIDYDYSNAPALEHSEGSGALITNVAGVLEGEFEIPCNNQYKFRSGAVSFELLELNTYSNSESFSAARAIYNVVGTAETEVISSMRLLEVVGSQTTSTESSVSTESTLSTTTVSDITGVSEVTITEETDDIPSETTIPATQPTNVVILDSVPDYTQGPAILGPVANNPYTGQNDFVIPDDYYTAPQSSPSILPEFDPIDSNNIDKYAPWKRNSIRKSNNVPFKYMDPSAQSFQVLDPNGIFVTRLSLYFASKPLDSNDTVSVELRPMENGTPSSTKMIAESLVSLHPNQVNVNPTQTIASMRSNATTFVFDEPIHLEGGTEYAFIVKSRSMEYKLYISQVEEYILGSNQERITKQPTLGSYYKSQNSYAWESDQTQDIAFVLHRAEFVSSGQAVLNSRKVPYTDLVTNPIVTNKASTEVTIICSGHGFRVGDTTSLIIGETFVETNGITWANLSGARIVTKVDAHSYTFNAGQSATKSGRTGGPLIRSRQNVIFETIRPIFAIEKPGGTNHTMFGKFLSTSSLASPASEAASRFTKDISYRLLKNDVNYSSFNKPMMLANPVDEVANLISGETSATIKVDMSTVDSRVSPAIDMQLANIAAISNLVDNQFGGELGSDNVPVRFVPETHPTLGTSAAKHVTIPINLLEESDGLKILLNANRPPQSEFHVFWRVSSGATDIRKQGWHYVTPEDKLPTDTNKGIFREYRYLVGGPNGGVGVDQFTTFQVKIVFASTNSTQVPLIRDLRCIALAV